MKSSKIACSVQGNWLLTSTYINSLSKIAYCALKNLSNNDSIKILKAAILGDTNGVVGICTLLNQIKKPNVKDRHDIVSTFLNGGSLAGSLRKVIDEAMGEIIESVQLFDDSLLQSFFDLVSQEFVITEDNITTILRNINTVEKFYLAFQKCVASTSSHLAGLEVAIDPLLKFIPSLKEDDLMKILRYCHACRAITIYLLLSVL